MDLFQKNFSFMILWYIWRIEVHRNVQDILKYFKTFQNIDIAYYIVKKKFSTSTLILTYLKKLLCSFIAWMK